MYRIWNGLTVVTPPLQLESLPPTSANSPPAQMDPPDRHGPPRKRDQVKGWLKKHLTGSTTPSPSRSPSPLQTNPSKDHSLQPSLGTAAKAGAGVNVSLMCESPSTGHDFYEGVKTTLRAIERAADVFTPLKSTAAALLVICDTIDAYGKNREEFERLLKRVDVISSIMASWPKDASQGAEDRFSGLSRTLVDMQKLLTKKIDEDRSKLERAMLTAQDGQEVLKITREIELAMEIALFEATATNERRTLQVVDGIGWIKDRICIIEETAGAQRNIEAAVEFLWKTELLNKLGNVNIGEYNNPKRGSECVPGTRLSLLSMLLAWAEDQLSPHLFWLNGLAGTGKTAVAKTLCSKLKERGILGATHFCTVKESELRNVYLIIPTLAKILAQEHPKFGAALQQILADDGACRNPTSMELKDQYAKLILQPAEQAFCKGPSERLLRSVVCPYLS
ncbi:hypothetical protein D9611_010559 [Ephemerocybe angulata]|uniref:Nephrocystin 3-like N-terminal domain-containing protein n=1 Tax=Ephemerocybe angulata TaxID=980116 RepID=A0A8H5BV89_9AGAR|nr:hypothetical protein D9611_010559 [Tulosesus angulatus]